MKRIVQIILVVGIYFIIAESAVFAEMPGKKHFTDKKTGESVNDPNSQKQSTGPYEIRVDKDLCYLGPERAEKFDLYSPISTDEKQFFPGIVIIHGGGWRWGDKARPRQIKIGTTLAQYGYVCMSINYLLSGPNKPSWPQNIYDCKAAVQFLRKNSKLYHVDPNHIGVIGGSAGGHLAAMVGLVGPEAGLEPPGLYKGISSRVQAVVPLYGVFNLLAWQSKKPRVEIYLGVTKEQGAELWKLASPVTHIDGNDPPSLIIHGTADQVVDYKQSVELHEKLQEKGVSSELVLIEGAPHSFDLQMEQRDIQPLVIGFFDKHLKDI
jgi:acetyl esterase/lipase